jgi:hypothetical protein
LADTSHCVDEYEAGGLFFIKAQLGLKTHNGRSDISGRILNWQMVCKTAAGNLVGGAFTPNTSPCSIVHVAELSQYRICFGT